MTTEYRREAARTQRGDSRLSDTGGFFHTQNQTIHTFTAAQRQKVRTIYGVLQTLVIALGAGLGIWGVINLLEGYGNDNRATRS